MDGRITEAAELLRKASDMLLESQGTVSSSPASTASTLSAAAIHSRPTNLIGQVGNRASAETLSRARAMIQSSRIGGVCRRLNQSERLRASLGTNFPRGKKGKKAEQVKEKPFQFALLNCTREDSDDEEDDNLRRRNDCRKRHCNFWRTRQQVHYQRKVGGIS